MKKLLSLFFVMLLSITAYNTVAFATPQDDDTTGMTVEEQPPVVEEQPEMNDTPEAAPAEEEVKRTMHQAIKKNFIDGGWQFMAIVLVCLILGLAVPSERIITLSFATVNTKKLLGRLEASIASGDIEGAKEICKATPGPTAEVLGEGLKRTDEGIDAVEKAIVSNGSVQTGLLEKGLVWLALFIALAPMLGFMGTVLGMIDAFNAIEQAGDIKPSDVAGGIKVALLTTVFGLITAIILQIFYNYITSKVDTIVNKMEDATISLVDILIDNNYAKPKNAED